MRWLPRSRSGRRGDLFWLLEQIMPRLHARAEGKPVHILGIADPASIPQVRRGSPELGSPARSWIAPVQHSSACLAQQRAARPAHTTRLTAARDLWL